MAWRPSTDGDVSRTRKPGRRGEYLRSRVARRVFALFVACALIPLTVLAFFAYLRISSEFTDRASEQLRQSGKFAAVSVLERLSSIEGDLRVVLESLTDVSPERFPTVLAVDGRRLDERLMSLSLVGPGGLRVDAFGEPVALGTLSLDESRHLESGMMLVRSRPKADGTPMVIGAIQTSSQGGLTLVAEVEPEYLWGGDGIVTDSAILFALDESRNILFASEAVEAPSAELTEALGYNATSGQFEWHSGEEPFLAGYWTLFMRPRFFPSWVFVYSEDQATILGPARDFGQMFLLTVLLSFWVVVMMSVRLIRRTMTPIETLAEAANRVADKDLSVRVDIQTDDEFSQLGQTFNRMTSHLETHIENLATKNEISLSLSSTTDVERLLETVVKGVKRIFNAGGAMLYLLDSNGSRTEGVAHVDLPGPQEHVSLPAIGAVVAGASLNLTDIYDTDDHDISAFRCFDEETGYRTQSFLGVPLTNHEGDVCGVLQVVNRRDPETGEVVRFSDKDQEALESLASETAVALSKNHLVGEFRNLFEALTELIAKAVDEKSPYTGEHCKRVPILTMMLADAVCETRQGPFADFSFTDDEMYELRISALLHDCGKVTTPVHIMDKRTKLETIVDRIDLIETRFEVLKRDKEIELLREALAQGGGTAGREVQQRLSEFEESVAQDLAFLRRCNYGSEGMQPEEEAGILRIAEQYRWQPAGAGPRTFLSEDEVRNLTVHKGTLTSEEREIINQHVVTTMKLLKDLPYPKNLRNVPVYAGAHHERMDGRGYPYGLKREEIALQGRIIGLADVFEALVAPDRPYKQGMKLSKTMEIMATMARNGHIDHELFETFVHEKVYERYARDYASPLQIDHVDEDALLESVASTEG